jgi:hypothetical protein
MKPGDYRIACVGINPALLNEVLQNVEVAVEGRVVDRIVAKLPSSNIQPVESILKHSTI